mmetsp:Transcript_14799/g.21151  ORF Transcript_14799/g.21151 Transcript_14799/m.21151 type:complete len:839 (+) Transcript_14799:79-2595(+)
MSFLSSLPSRRRRLRNRHQGSDKKRRSNDMKTKLHTTECKEKEINDSANNQISSLSPPSFDSKSIKQNESADSNVATDSFKFISQCLKEEVSKKNEDNEDGGEGGIDDKLSIATEKTDMTSSTNGSNHNWNGESSIMTTNNVLSRAEYSLEFPVCPDTKFNPSSMHALCKSATLCGTENCAKFFQRIMELFDNMKKELCNTREKIQTLEKELGVVRASVENGSNNHDNLRFVVRQILAEESPSAYVDRTLSPKSIPQNRSTDNIVKSTNMYSSPQSAGVIYKGTSSKKHKGTQIPQRITTHSAISFKQPLNSLRHHQIDSDAPVQSIPSSLGYKRKRSPTMPKRDTRYIVTSALRATSHNRHRSPDRHEKHCFGKGIQDSPHKNSNNIKKIRNAYKEPHSKMKTNFNTRTQSNITLNEDKMKDMDVESSVCSPQATLKTVKQDATKDTYTEEKSNILQSSSIPNAINSSKASKLNHVVANSFNSQTFTLTTPQIRSLPSSTQNIYDVFQTHDKPSKFTNKKLIDDINHSPSSKLKQSPSRQHYSAQHPLQLQRKRPGYCSRSSFGIGILNISSNTNPATSSNVKETPIDANVNIHECGNLEIYNGSVSNAAIKRPTITLGPIEDSTDDEEKEEEENNNDNISDNEVIKDYHAREMVSTCANETVSTVLSHKILNIKYNDFDDERHIADTKDSSSAHPNRCLLNQSTLHDEVQKESMKISTSPSDAITIEHTSEIQSIDSNRDRATAKQNSSIPVCRPISLKMNNHKYVEVVRNKSERREMPGHVCEHCKGFIDALCYGEGGKIFDRKALVTDCSRHRSKFTPPSTPEGFWELSFPDEK